MRMMVVVVGGRKKGGCRWGGREGVGVEDGKEDVRGEDVAQEGVLVPDQR